MKRIILASTLSALSFGAMSATLPTDLNWQTNWDSCRAFLRLYAVLVLMQTLVYVLSSWMKRQGWWFATQIRLNFLPLERHFRALVQRLLQQNGC